MLSRLIPALLILCFCLPVAAKPKFPPPPKSQITRIGDNMTYNGIPMDIRLFGSRESAVEIIDYYKGVWPKGDEKTPGYAITTALQPWTIITYVKDGYLMTVQVSPAKKSSGSTGYLAMSRMPAADADAPDLASDFPKLRGSYVANDIQSKDLMKRGRTIILSNSSPVSTNANFYRDHFLNRGYEAQMDRAISGGKMHTFRFQNGNQNVSIVINGGKLTSVTAQITKEGMF